MYSDNKPNAITRPYFSVLTLVKFIGVVTVLNTFLTISSFFVRNEEFAMPKRSEDILELSRFPGEKLSSDVVRGAPLITLTSKSVFARLRNSSNENARLEHETVLSKIFFSVRTSNQYHEKRLKVLLDTWIASSHSHTWIFTDQKDNWLSKYISHKFSNNNSPTVIYTNCPKSADQKWALLCKMYWEYRTFLNSDKSWFCHFDDDTFVNVGMLTKLLNLFSYEHEIYIGRSPSKTPVTAMAYDTENVKPEIYGFNETTNETYWEMPEITYKRVSFHFALGGAGFCLSRRLALDMKEHAFGSRLLNVASSISLPDDCVIGYVVTHLLNVSLISTNLMHTHMEDLTRFTEPELLEQVTLSYAFPNTEKKNNKIVGPVENAENSVFFYKNSSNKYFKSPSLSKPNTVIFSIEDDPTGFKSLQHLIDNRENK